MAPYDRDGAGVLQRVLAIGAAVAAMIALILLVGPLVESEHVEAPAAVRGSPGRPIPEEADVFRTRPDAVAVGSDAARRNAAHPRTLRMYRSLRAYPGAPPRVPHGLTAEEYRSTGCEVCHERGGWVERFSAYAPITPHPEFRNCLQCHVPDDRVVGIGLPDGTPNALCLQCHSHAPLQSFAALDWRPAAWPAIGQRTLPGSPPAIPHALQLRGNCLACHLGPSGVEEIRTTHPERANCRQCHVPAQGDADAPADVFTRPLDGGAAPHGGRP